MMNVALSNELSIGRPWYQVMAGWLNSQVDWSVGWSAGWLVDQQVGQWVKKVGWLGDRSCVCLVG